MDDEDMPETNLIDDADLPATQLIDDRILKGQHLSSIPWFQMKSFAWCTLQFFLDVVPFVDVRTDHDNRSKFVAHQLELLGATVSKTLNKTVTHVIFKDGGQGTYRKAKRMGKHLLSVLWIER